MCVTPLELKRDEYTVVPCGKCIECKKRRASGWSFRLMQEDKRSTSALFITLTYAPEHVPITAKKYMTLRKEDYQKFMKRLRKRCDQKLKYYACGEYGTDSWRPHYHAILYNASIDKVKESWMLDDKEIGYVDYGTVTGASIGYVLKYISKPKRVPLHQNDDRLPEFSLMSKRLGANYMTDEMVAWHKMDLENRMYCVVEGGQKISMPRYYKDKMYSDDERELISSRAALDMISRKEEYEQEMLKMYGESWQYVRKEQVEESFERMYRSALKNRDKI